MPQQSNNDDEGFESARTSPVPERGVMPFVPIESAELEIPDIFFDAVQTFFVLPDELVLKILLFAGIDTLAKFNALRKVNRQFRQVVGDGSIVAPLYAKVFPASASILSTARRLHAAQPEPISLSQWWQPRLKDAASNRQVDPVAHIWRLLTEDALRAAQLLMDHQDDAMVLKTLMLRDENGSVLNQILAKLNSPQVFLDYIFECAKQVYDYEEGRGLPSGKTYYISRERVLDEMYRRRDERHTVAPLYNNDEKHQHAHSVSLLDWAVYCNQHGFIEAKLALLDVGHMEKLYSALRETLSSGVIKRKYGGLEYPPFEVSQLQNSALLQAAVPEGFWQRCYQTRFSDKLTRRTARFISEQSEDNTGFTVEQQWLERFLTHSEKAKSYNDPDFWLYFDSDPDAFFRELAADPSHERYLKTLHYRTQGERVLDRLFQRDASQVLKNIIFRRARAYHEVPVGRFEKGRSLSYRYKASAKPHTAFTLDLLDWAILLNQDDFIDSLIQQYEEKAPGGEKTWEASKVILKAIEHNNQALFERLLNENPELANKTMYGSIAMLGATCTKHVIHSVVSEGRIEMLAFLLQDKFAPLSLVRTTNNNGQIPLHFCCYGRKTESSRTMASMLLAHDPLFQMNHHDSIYRCSPKSVLQRDLASTESYMQDDKPKARLMLDIIEAAEAEALAARDAVGVNALRFLQP